MGKVDQRGDTKKFRRIRHLLAHKIPLKRGIDNSSGGGAVSGVMIKKKHDEHEK